MQQLQCTVDTFEQSTTFCVLRNLFALAALVKLIRILFRRLNPTDTPKVIADVKGSEKSESKKPSTGGKCGPLVGQMAFHIIQGNGIQKSNALIDDNLFVKVKIANGDQSYSFVTRSLSREDVLAWNDRFLANVNDESKTVIRIRVYSGHTFKANQLLGSANITLENLSKLTVASPQKIKLNGGGSLDYEFVYLPFSDISPATPENPFGDWEAVYKFWYGEEKFLKEMKQNVDEDRELEKSIKGEISKKIGVAEGVAGFLPKSYGCCRGTHPVGVGASGTATLSNDFLPGNSFFKSGGKFDITIRHANSSRLDNELGMRAFSFTFHSQNATSEPVLEMLMNTGPIAPFWNWDSFKIFGKAMNEPFHIFSPQHINLTPLQVKGLIGSERFLPESFASQHYYGGIAIEVDSAEGKMLSRWRVIPADPKVKADGFLNAERQLNPFLPGAETHSKSYLRDEFKSKVANGVVTYKLQAQVVKLPEDAKEYNVACNMTKAWDADWKDVAELKLDTVLSDPCTERLSFNVGTLPEGLYLPSCYHIGDMNSVSYLRSTVYPKLQRIRLRGADAIPTVQYTAGKNEPFPVLIVDSINLKGLPQMDTLSSTSEIYVKFSSKKSGLEFQTYVNPVEDEARFEVKRVLLEAENDFISFSVLDQDIGSDDTVGSFSVYVSEIWEDLVKNKKCVVEGKFGDNDCSSYSITFSVVFWNSNYQNLDAPEKIGMNMQELVMWKTMKKVRDDAVPTSITADKLQKPKKKRQLQMQEGPGDIILPTTDAQVPILGTLPKMMAKMAINQDVSDINTPIPSRAGAINWMSDVMQPYLPVPVDGNFDRTTDEGLTLMFTQGIAASTLVRTPEGFMADYDGFKKYKSRPPYVSPQGKIYFDSKCKATHIDVCGNKVYPGEDQWEFAKFVIRSSVLNLITVREHLVYGHFVWSNYTSTAARQHLSADHPLRMLIHPHTYRAHFVNDTSLALLVSEDGLLCHNMCWDFSELTTILADTVASFNFQTFPSRLKNQEIDTMGDISLFIQDSVKYYGIVRTYVDTYLGSFFKDDSAVANDSDIVDFWKFLQDHVPNGLPALSKLSLCEFIAEFIFQVTGYHFHNGHVISYTDPACRSGRILPNTIVSSKEAWELTTKIALSTAIDMPMLMEEWNHLLPQEAQPIYQTFKSSMKQFGAEIDERNKHCEPFETFNPKFHHLSIAV